MGEGRNCICYVEEKIGGGKSAPGGITIPAEPSPQNNFWPKSCKNFSKKKQPASVQNDFKLALSCKNRLTQTISELLEA